MSAPQQLGFAEMALPPISRAKRMRNAHAAADLGIGRSADSAEREIPGWIAKAVEAVGQFARGQHGMFTMETCRWVLQQTLEQPRELRSWGQVTKQAKAAGFIEATNQVSPTHSSNGSPKPMWRRGPKA